MNDKPNDAIEMRVEIEQPESGYKRGYLSRISIWNSIRNKFKQIFPCGFKHDAWLLMKNALVLIIGNLCQIMFIVMSTMFCGHLGVRELNAVAIANTFTILANISPIIGMASACDTLFPRLFSGDDKSKLGLALQKGCILLALTGLVCSIALANAEFILSLVSNQPEVNKLASDFLFINTASPIFYGIHIAASRYLEVQGVLKPIVLTGLIANVINASLHATLLFGFHLGVKGSAIANLVANLFQPLILISYILISRVYEPTWPGWSKECFRGWWEFLKLGLPGIILEVLDWSYFDIAVIATGWLGPIQLSITSIGSQIVWIASMVYMGLSVSGNIVGGNYLGQNSPKKAFNSIKVLLTLGFFTSLIQSIGILSLSSYLPLIFLTDRQVLEAIDPIMKYMPICVFVESIQSYGSGVLKTAGAQKYAMAFNMICFYLVGMPLGYFLIFKSGLKALGFFISHSIVGGLLILSQMIFICSVDWKKTAKEAHEKENKNKKKKQANEIEIYSFSIFRTK